MPKQNTNRDDKFAKFRGNDDTGDKIYKAKDIIKMKIQGQRKHGKTTFFLSFIDYFASKLSDNTPMRMCIVEADIEGQRTALKRGVVSKNNLDFIQKKSVDSFTDMVEWTNYYIHLMEQHAKQYPDDLYGRWLVVESDQKVLELATNEYAHQSRGKTYNQLVYENQARAIKDKKQTMPAFKEGPRDSYKAIHAKIQEYYTNLFMSAELVGFNVVVTDMLVSKTRNFNTDNEYIEIVPGGRTWILDPFVEVIVDCIKQSEIQERKSGSKKISSREKKSTYLLDVDANRYSSDFIMPNSVLKDGPGPFFRRLFDNYDMGVEL
jgi:hypothetical protein